MPFHRTVGIVGGMGPFAGAALLERVFRTAATVHGARENHEFPRVLLASAPVCALVSDDRAEAEAVAMIRTEVAHLRAAGATLFAIACVTMHAYLPAIRGAVAPTEWISLPDVAAEQVVALGSKRPLLLGSPTTARKQVLALPLEARGVTPVLLGPEDEERLVAVIHALVGGAPESSVLPVLRELEAAAASRGADSLVLGCTELSPFASALSRLPAVDPLDAAARAICARAALRLRE